MKLRIKFYNIKNNRVKNIVINRDILFDLNDKKKGWISIDLTPYNISFNAGQDIAVTMVLLNPAECDGIDFTGNIFKANCILRDGVFDRWYTGSCISLYLGATSYRP